MQVIGDVGRSGLGGVLWLTISFLCVGCITSPVWEYGATADAKKAKLGPCPNGLLDDVEDGNGQIIENAGRDGYWFTFVDEWGSKITPRGEFKPEAGGPSGQGHAAHMVGQLARSGDSLYAGMGFAFTNPKTPFDVGEAKGVRFWAKGPAKVRFKTPDANTAPEGDRCTDCYNDFGVDLFLQAEWTRYTIPFDQLAQQPGWGDRAPEVDRKGLFAIQWQYSTPDTPFDVWVDDVELVGCGEAK